MFSEAEHEDYKLKVELLQEKLQKSEENRLLLEQQLDIILHQHDNRKKKLYKQSRRRYEHFLEEQEKHNERNKKLMQMLDGINHETTALAARTERLKKHKLQYEMYLANLLQYQSVGYMPTSASDKNASIKSIPILIPSTISELTHNSNTSLGKNTAEMQEVMEELSKTLNGSGNMQIPAELTSCQWKFAMATPLPAGMLLMPTSSINLTSAKENSPLNSKNTDKSDDENTTQDDVMKGAENKDQFSRSHDFDSVEKNSNSEEIHEIMNENASKTIEVGNFELTKKAEEENSIAVETLPSNNLEELVDENYLLNDGQPEVNNFNFYSVPEAISKPPQENLETKMNELQISTVSAPKETNIENIENAIYGELVEPIENNLYSNNESTLQDSNGIKPLEINYAEQENILAENTYDVNFNANQVNYAPEMERNVDDFNYEPTLVTTEAELYSQSTLDAGQKQDFDDNDSQYVNDINNQQIVNEPLYENIDYANYDASQYENQYENVENVYDNNNVYPGYTFDEATGQYLSDETQLPVDANTDVNYNDAQNDLVHDENYQPFDEASYGKKNNVENIENSNDDLVDPIESIVDKNMKPQLEGKSVKPILATPSSATGSTGSNEAQKKKKRVNFVDNKNGKDANEPGENSAEQRQNIKT